MSSLSVLAEFQPQAINLSHNHPPHNVDPDLSLALRTLARRDQVQQLLEYPQPSGMPRHREAGARWLATLGLETDPDSIIISAGAQHAILITLSALCEPGDIVLAESYTYPGVMAAANRLSLEMLGVPMDDDGILPEALEATCRQHRARILYLNPTYQNPTNGILPESRKREIVAIAEKYNLLIIEDEILRPLADEPPALFSSMAPERCCLLISASKTIAAGLRIGFVVAPSKFRQNVTDSLKMSLLGASPLPAEILATWITEGTAARVIESRKKELAERQRIVQQILGGYGVVARGSSCHAWLRLPPQWSGMEFGMESQRRGVSVAPAEIFAIDRRASVNAVRISVGPPWSQQILQAGLEILAGILGGYAFDDMATV